MGEKPIVLDGLTGEGGGQLVRLGVCLSALTTRAVKITNVRGNRAASKKGDSQGGGEMKKNTPPPDWDRLV